MTKAHEPKFAENIDVARLLVMKEQVEEWRLRIDKALEAVRGNGHEGIACYNWPSAIRGRKQFDSFMDELKESTMAMKMGEPYKVGQPKPRSTSQKKRGKETTLQAERDARLPKKSSKPKGA